MQTNTQVQQQPRKQIKSKKENEIQLTETSPPVGRESSYRLSFAARPFAPPRIDQVGNHASSTKIYVHDAQTSRKLPRSLTSQPEFLI
jgi:hypothetical protein